MKSKKKMILLVLAVFLILCISGCNKKVYEGYKGDFPELYTIAVNSLLGARGYSGGSSEPMYYDPTIEVLEKDLCGRILFYYYENSGELDGDNSFLSLIICQKADDDFVYYYSEDCFVLQRLEWEVINISNQEYHSPKPFLEETIDELKRKNDWNQEFFTSKCIKNPVIRKSEEPKVKFKNQNFEEIFKKIANDVNYKGTDELFRWATYLTSDNEGKILYYAFGWGNDFYGEGVSTASQDRKFYLMIIVNQDGSYDLNKCVQEITYLFDYQEQLKLFKASNNWKTNV